MINVIVGADISTQSNRDIVDAEFCKTLLRDMTPVTDKADFRIANLENVLCEEGTGEPIIKSGPNLYGLPKNVAFLNELKVDCAVLANNHFGDYGEEAIVSTLDILKENNIAKIGGGMNKKEAYAAWYAEKDGIKISFIAVCENEFGCATDNTAGSAGFDMKLLRDRIVEEKGKADFVVVIFHGGNEHDPVPSPAVIDRYRLLIDFGADALVGMHTHCMQGFETYEGKPIIYSMGNLFFRKLSEAMSGQNPWNYGYLTELHFEKGKNITFDVIPYALIDDDKWLHVLEGDARDRILAYLDKISAIIQDRKEINRLYDAWCVSSGVGYARALSYKPEFEMEELTPEIRKLLAPQRNRFSCEAHNHLVTNFLRLVFDGRIEEAKAAVADLNALKVLPY